MLSLTCFGCLKALVYRLKIENKARDCLFFVVFKIPRVSLPAPNDDVKELNGCSHEHVICAYLHRSVGKLVWITWKLWIFIFLWKFRMQFSVLHKKWWSDTFYLNNMVLFFGLMILHKWKSQVKSSHLYLYSAFNNTNCNKALHNIKIGKFCQ